MKNEFFPLPPNLPVPEDDGAADHLNGTRLPDIRLPATNGTIVRLSDLDHAVIFTYPRTGTPGRDPGPSWDAIPGAADVRLIVAAIVICVASSRRWACACWA